MGQTVAVERVIARRDHIRARGVLDGVVADDALGVVPFAPPGGHLVIGVGSATATTAAASGPAGVPRVRCC